jgi:hypothetical protein
MTDTTSAKASETPETMEVIESMYVEHRNTGPDPSQEWIWEPDFNKMRLHAIDLELRLKDANARADAAEDACNGMVSKDHSAILDDLIEQRDKAIAEHTRGVLTAMERDLRGQLADAQRDAERLAAEGIELDKLVSTIDPAVGNGAAVRRAIADHARACRAARQELAEAKRWPDDLEAGYLHAMELAKVAGATQDVLDKMRAEWEANHNPAAQHECFWCGAVRLHFAELEQRLAEAQRSDEHTRGVLTAMERDLRGQLARLLGSG